jgi:hypothetical protein
MKKDAPNKKKEIGEKKLKNESKAEPVVVVPVEEEVEAAEPPEELDPEILAALNVSKRKKKGPTKDIDYIPELERGDIDIDAGLEGDF